jgi:hypothetical protein
MRGFLSTGIHTVIHDPYHPTVSLPLTFCLSRRPHGLLTTYPDLMLLQGTIQTECYLVFDWRLSTRAFDGGAIGSEVLQRWTFGYVDLVPSTAFVVVFDVDVVIAVTFTDSDVDKLDPDPNFWEQQRRFEQHVGCGRSNSCVWDPYRTWVDPCWECFWVIHGLYTLLSYWCARLQTSRFVGITS